ncbi:complement factor H-like [Fundulus diaphanus]
MLSLHILLSMCCALSCVTSDKDVITVFEYEDSAAMVSCPYAEGYEDYEKYLCKDDCSSDDVLITTSQRNTYKYSIDDDKISRIFEVIISNLSFEDAGKYWCGVTRTGKDIYTEVKLEVGKAIRDCDKPDITNGFAVGPLEDKLYYSCNENFKLPTKSWWGEATCNDGAWDELHSCIAKHCGPPPKVENAVITVPYQTEYLINHSVTYQCREKYTIEQEASITCRDGKWESKNIKCIQSCEKLSDSRLTVETAMEKEEYREGEVIQYVCTAPGVMAGGTATCENGKWKKTEECPGIPCELPQLDPNLGILGSAPRDNQVNSGTTLAFACEGDYDLEGSDEIRCLETGKWDAPLPTCSEKCKRPEVPQNVRITSSVQGNALSKGDKLSFACNRRTDFMQGSASIDCLGNGQWSAPPPQCGAPIVCSAPPALEDGDTKSYIGSDSVFQHGDKVEYICQQTYTMSGEPFKTCDNGVWIGDIRCLTLSKLKKPLES